MRFDALPSCKKEGRFDVPGDSIMKALLSHCCAGGRLKGGARAQGPWYKFSWRHKSGHRSVTRAQDSGGKMQYRSKKTRVRGESEQKI